MSEENYTLANTEQEIVDKIMSETDMDSLKKLISIFNVNQAKKSVLRIIKQDGVRDKIVDNIERRVEETPGEFTNDDLRKILQTLEDSIDKAKKDLGVVDETPTIQFNQQNNVNVVVGDGIDLDRDERQNVMDAINAILNGSKVSSIVGDNNEIDEN